MSADELRAKERELQEQLFRLRFQKSIGQLDNALKIRETRRDIARVKTVLRQKQGQAAAGAGQVGGNGSTEADERAEAGSRAAATSRSGMVVKAKMQKTVVVAVERLVRHAVYRKTIKRTSTFMAHDEKGAKQGDTVRIVETRPLSQAQALAGGGDPGRGAGRRGRRRGRGLGGEPP